MEYLNNTLAPEETSSLYKEVRHKRPRIKMSNALKNSGCNQRIEKAVYADKELTYDETTLTKLESLSNHVKDCNPNDRESFEYIYKMAKNFLNYRGPDKYIPKHTKFDCCKISEKSATEILSDISKLIIKAKSRPNAMKMLSIIDKPNYEDAVSAFLQNKDEIERLGIARELIKYFKEPLTQKNKDINAFNEDDRQKDADKRMDDCNKILQALGYKIVKIKNIKTPPEIQQVIRAAFVGRLYIPSKEDTEFGSGYSPEYQRFANLIDSTQHHKKSSPYTPLPAYYDFADTKLGQAFALSDNMKMLIPHIHRAICEAKLPKEVAENLSLSDVAHLMVQQKGLRKQDYISFEDINKRCSTGTREKFWKNLSQDTVKLDLIRDTLLEMGVDKEFICDWLSNIRKNGAPHAEREKKYHPPIPDFSIHHKFHIQDAAAQRNAMLVDDISNFELCIDFPSLGINTHKANGKEFGFKHLADTKSIDGKHIYRLVSYPEEKGRETFISIGTKQIFTETKKKKNLQSYIQMSEREARQ